MTGADFLARLRDVPDSDGFDVRHDYVACVAQKPEK